MLYHEAVHALSDAGPHDSPGLLEPSSPLPSSPARPPLRLRPGLTLHLYTSSVPCGNAALRRWAKPAPHDEEATIGRGAAGAGGWPIVPHPRLLVHARQEGQVGDERSGGRGEYSNVYVYVCTYVRTQRIR